MSCSGEGCKCNFIVNKKYNLCESCNWKRLHPNKDRFEEAIKKQKPTSLIIYQKPNPQKPLKNCSKKGASILNEYNQVCKQILEEREHICSGCGIRQNLSFSHLIPRSRRRDLITDKNNIQLHCTESFNGSKGCHQKWEGNFDSKKTLMDFEENMKYIEKQDPEYYRVILYKSL